MASSNPVPSRIIVFGANGTIGRAVVEAAADAGHEVVAITRRDTHFGAKERAVRIANVENPRSVIEHAFRNERFDAVISCLASRTGAPKDTQAIDFRANCHVLDAAEATGTPRFVMLSAICVQKPRLAFQHAKLAFEERLQRSAIDWTIIRPTAFFKSLSGQVDRVRKGKPFLLFGHGEITRCKPISDRDLARFMLEVALDPAARGRVLPIGGPGPALSPKDQAAILFELTGQEPRYRSIAPGLFLAISSALRPLAKVSDWATEKAEYLRIAHYYATESMLLIDPETGEYCADATPEFGQDSLRGHYQDLLKS